MNLIAVGFAVYDRVVDIAFGIYADLFCAAEQAYDENKTWCSMVREAFTRGGDIGAAFIEEEKWKTAS